jgi:hypothetical protein
MLFSGFLVAFFVALALAALFVVGFGSGRSGDGSIWAGFMLFFLVVWLATWGIGSWLTPIGPVAYGLPWLSFVLIGVMVALIAAAAAPPSRHRHAPGGALVHAEESPTSIGFGIFFWILLAFVIFTIFARWAWSPM